MKGAGINVAMVPKHMQVFTGDSNETASHQLRHHHDPQKTNGSGVHQVAKVRTDQLALVLAEVIIMAQSAVLIGPQVSNVDRVIAELMGTVRWPPLIDDVYHDKWVPGALAETHNSVAWAVSSMATNTSLP
mgnify:CR=1 FL=1|jgi:hypothetical protein